MARSQGLPAIAGMSLEKDLLGPAKAMRVILEADAPVLAEPQDDCNPDQYLGFQPHESLRVPFFPIRSPDLSNQLC